MNIVLLRGRLSRPAELRVLPSGDPMVAYEVTIPRPEERADTVPVVWHRPPPAASTLDVDQEVVVVGRVVRRFFKTGGRTGSRTEVVAEVVVPSRQRKRAHAAVDAALRRARDDEFAVAE